MTAKFTDTNTNSFEMQVFRELGEISSDVKSIKERLEKGDERFEVLAKDQRELPCKQAASCPDSMKSSGWGRPAAYVAGGSVAGGMVLWVIEFIKTIIQTKGV